jgi:hypothetical protein
VIKILYLPSEVQIKMKLVGLEVVDLLNVQETIMFWFMIKMDLSLVLKSKLSPTILGLEQQSYLVRKLVPGMVLNVLEKILLL